MAYWIQEIGGTGQRANFRMYNCDFRADIANLPLNDREGVRQGDDSISCTKAHFGDRCLCLEDSSVHELGNETNEWKEL